MNTAQENYTAMLTFGKSVLLKKKGKSFPHLLANLLRHLEEDYPYAEGVILSKAGQVVQRCCLTTSLD